MNSWKLNSTANYLVRKAICKYFQLEMNSVYRSIKSIDGTKITAYNGKVYELTLREIEDGTSL